ncbi:unnamed protein product [Periconia digitata]|uniref:DUF7605 domain-containing protein n=1 Tax=Periconia digitata TaxID=1303443 RepID=A0A9W4UN13_9PLEO|nr:unnamed protein product [Periconia digitata]
MITRISNNIEEAMEHANSDIGFRAMKQARSDINKYRAGKRFELQRHLITVRNRSVSRGLRKKYAEHPAARNLQIFCVSNTMYEEKRHDLVAEVKPHLQLSGIIELRRHCMGISAESYLRQTKEYINHRVSAFVASLELWAQTSLGDMNEERNQQVLQVVSAAQEYTNKLTRPDSRLAALSESLHSEFESCVSLKLRDKKRTVRWVEDAAQIAKKWNKWYASSYKAFCLNFGEHSTKTVRRCSWNELAMSTMFKDMKYIWALFTSSLTDCYNDTRVFIEDSFLELEMDLSRARGKPIFHELLVSTLRFRKSAFLRAIENIVKDFSDGSFLTLQNECLSPLRTAFLGQVMEVTYHEANMEYGRGSDLRRKGRITSRFGSDRLIEDYHSLIRDAFADTAKGLESKVKEAADQYIVFIEADLQIIGDEHAITESSESQEFRSRVAEEVKGTKEVLERINLVCMDEAPN